MRTKHLQTSSPSDPARLSAMEAVNEKFFSYAIAILNYSFESPLGAMLGLALAPDSCQCVTAGQG